MANKPSRVYYLIYVPQGWTAHQSTPQRLYYIRDEFRANPMLDSHIRARMMRGKYPQANISIADLNLRTAEEEFHERKENLLLIKKKIEDIPKHMRLINLEFVGLESALRKQEKLIAEPKRNYDELIFNTAIKNIGEVTLKDFLLNITVNNNIEVNENKQLFTETHRFAESRKIVKQGKHEIIPEERKLFPHQEIIIPNHKWIIKIPHKSIISEKDFKPKVTMDWEIFLDNGIPSTGKIDILKNAATLIPKINELL